MTKNRSGKKRSDRDEKATPSRHVGLGAQRTSLANRGGEDPAEPAKMVDVASVGRPILGEYRAVQHGW